MGLFDVFKKKPKNEEAKKTDPINKNYVCIPFDPIHSMNDLRKGDWNMDKVQESFAIGLVFLPSSRRKRRGFPCLK